MAGREDYEERRQGRIDRYREQAQKAQEESDRQYQRSHKMAEAIPMGQPILVGHHSEARDRRYREKIQGAMDKSIEASDKSGYYAGKAVAAENNNAISSDDPDCIEKLYQKLTLLQNRQDEMKKANAYYRKHGTMAGYPRLSDEQAASWDREINAGYSWDQKPYPAYELTNNNANIGRIKKRIAKLEALEARPVQTDIHFEGGLIREDTEINRVQIILDERPDDELYRQLKGYGFKRIHTPEHIFQRLRSNNAWEAAKKIAGVCNDGAV